jgi:hypothetical protein
MFVEGNVPIVEVRFKTPSGRERKARFVVDSGGGSFILGTKLAADVGAKRVGKVVGDGDTNFQPIEPVRAWAGDLELDTTNMANLAQVGNDRMGGRDQAEGLIPSRLLRKYRMIFDYPGRTLTFAKPSKDAGRGVRLDASINEKNGLPRIEAEVAGKRYGFLLDTGASFSMMSKVTMQGWLKQHPDWSSATGAFGFANMMGGKMESEALMLRISEMKIGPVTIADAAAVSRNEGTYEKSMSNQMTAPIAGAIGGNVLRDFRIEIDYQNGYVYLDRATNSTHELSGVGLVLAPSTHGLRVNAIASTSADDVKASVHPGDDLIAVDGVVLDGQALTLAAQALAGSPGSKKRLTLMRGGDQLVVAVTCSELL